MQEFYDATGARCAQSEAWFVVTTRETEWDESSRGRALRLGEYEGGICGCGCGLPATVARDPDQVFVVDDFTCHAGRALDMVREEKRKQAEALKQPATKPGQHLYVRPHDPDRDGPLKPPPSQSRRTRADEVSPGPPQGRQR